MDSDIGNLIGFLIPILLIVLAAGFLLGRSGRDNRDLSGPPPPSMQGPPRDIAAPPPVPPPDCTGTLDIRQQVSTIRDLDAATLAGIKAAMESGNKIEAIKLLREASGMGLKESKEAVEAMFKAAGK